MICKRPGVVRPRETFLQRSAPRALVWLLAGAVGGAGCAKPGSNVAVEESIGTRSLPAAPTTPFQAVFYNERDAVPLDSASTFVSRPVGVTSASSTHHVSAHQVALHVHERHDETVVILRGEGEFQLGEQTVPVFPGLTIVIPRGTLHGFQGNGEKGLVEAISVFSPPFDGKDRHFHAPIRNLER